MCLPVFWAPLTPRLLHHRILRIFLHPYPPSASPPDPSFASPVSPPPPSPAATTSPIQMSTPGPMTPRSNALGPVPIRPPTPDLLLKYPPPCHTKPASAISSPLPGPCPPSAKPLPTISHPLFPSPSSEGTFTPQNLHDTTSVVPGPPSNPPLLGPLPPWTPRLLHHRILHAFLHPDPPSTNPSGPAPHVVKTLPPHTFTIIRHFKIFYSLCATLFTITSPERPRPLATPTTELAAFLRAQRSGSQRRSPPGRRAGRRRRRSRGRVT